MQPMNSGRNSVLNAKPVAIMGGIRVVARIRPQQNSELEKDCIVSATGPDGDASSQPTVVRIPSFKNENEAFSFQFSSVYDQASTQQAIFDNESRWLRTASSGDFNLLMMSQSPPRSSISSMDSTLLYSHMVLQAPAKHTQCGVENHWPNVASSHVYCRAPTDAVARSRRTPLARLLWG